MRRAGDVCFSQVYPERGHGRGMLNLSKFL